MDRGFNNKDKTVAYKIIPLRPIGFDVWVSDGPLSYHLLLEVLRHNYHSSTVV